MSVRSSVPWGLLLPAALILFLALARGADDPPAPPESSAYTWTRLHAHGAEARGPMGMGSMFNDVEQNSRTLIATSFFQSLYSTDSGASWSNLAVFRGVDVAFGDDGLVLVGRPEGELSRSVDAGAHWTDVKTDAEGFLMNLSIKGTKAFATEAGAVLRSDDAGQTWRRIPTTRVRLGALDSSGALVIAVGGAGLVVRSDDGGDTWHEQWLPRYDAVSGVACADDRTVIIVGSDGAIWRSTDAGVTWNPVPSPTQAQLQAVRFANAREGMAVGFWGEVIRTADGGATWERERSGTNMHLLAVGKRPEGGFLVAGARELVLAAVPGGSR